MSSAESKKTSMDALGPALLADERYDPLRNDRQSRQSLQHCCCVSSHTSRACWFDLGTSWDVSSPVCSNPSGMISFWQTTCHQLPGPGFRWKLLLIALPCHKHTLDSRTRHAFQAWPVSMGYPFGSLTSIGMVTGPNVAQWNLVHGFCWNCGEEKPLVWCLEAAFRV